MQRQAREDASERTVAATPPPCMSCCFCTHALPPVRTRLCECCAHTECESSTMTVMASRSARPCGGWEGRKEAARWLTAHKGQQCKGCRTNFRGWARASALCTC